MTEQEKYIGIHPVAPNIFGLWWNSTDLPTSGNKKHRKMEEVAGVRSAAVDALAKWIVERVHPHSKKMIQRRKAILDKHGLEEFVDKMKLLPKAENKGTGDRCSVPRLKISNLHVYSLICQCKGIAA